MTMTEIQTLLTGLMRGIDKKTHLTIEVGADPARPAVTVHLSCGKRSGSLQLSVADLTAGQTDLMRRNRLRTALKQAHDRMWAETGYIFSTKTERPKSDAQHWFRPPQGGGGRGRR
jgi:hypothetical protein